MGGYAYEDVHRLEGMGSGQPPFFLNAHPVMGVSSFTEEILRESVYEQCKEPSFWRDSSQLNNHHNNNPLSFWR